MSLHVDVVSQFDPETIVINLLVLMYASLTLAPLTTEKGNLRFARGAQYFLDSRNSDLWTPGAAATPSEYADHRLVNFRCSQFLLLLSTFSLEFYTYV